MIERISVVLMVVGAAFMLLGALGVLRLPDLFMRLQAATKASTLGVSCMLLGLAVHFQDVSVTTRAVLVIAFFFLTAPVGAHLIARAGYAAGAPLWEGTIIDELRAAQPIAKPDRSDDSPPAPTHQEGDSRHMG